MARPGFYNDNEYRAYPFVFKTDYLGAALPNSAVVDCGLIMGLDSGFDPVEHAVWLSRISRAGGEVTFELETDAPGAAGATLSFACAEGAADWTVVQAEAGDSGTYSPCGTEPLWEGFLVPGPLTELVALLAENGDELVYGAGERALEPSRIQSLVKSYVRSINVGNFRRVRCDPPSICEAASESVSDDIAVNATCMQGPIRLKEGYNCRIRQTERTRELRVFAESGAGDTDTQELCAHGGELPLYAGEPYDPETGFFSGGPSCRQVISTVNGVGGANVNITGGTGVSVTADAETSTLTIALVRNNLVGKCET